MSQKWLVRLVTVIVSMATATAGGTLVAAAPAQACCAVRVIQVPCPSWAGSEITTYYNPVTVVSTDHGFMVSEGRVIHNDLPYPNTGTFTSTITTTFTVGATIGVQITKLVEWLQINVSSTITQATAIAIGVSATATIPPFGRVNGDYGVESFHVTFDAEYVFRRQAIGGCWIFEHDGGFTRASASAPTYRQGWRIYPG